jgi:hypothetical protein
MDKFLVQSTQRNTIMLQKKLNSVARKMTNEGEAFDIILWEDQVEIIYSVSKDKH